MQFDNVKNLRPKSKGSIKVEGSLSGETWMGEFEFWTVLTHRQQLDRDRIQRDFLGSNLEALTGPGGERIKNQSRALADMQVRIFKAPTWWLASNMGLDLVDDEVITAIYDMIIKAENDYYLEREKKVAAAKGELQTLAPPDDSPRG